MILKRPVAVLVLAFATTLASCGDENAGSPEVVTLSMNVYYGFDVGPLLASESSEEIPLLAAQAFQQLMETDFPSRAEAIADTIARENPHLVGLQEVALIHMQTPSDAIEGGPSPAEDVVFDYLEILLAALAARGLDYHVAGSVQNTDIELPMVTGVDPLTFSDIRLVDRDVVLARGDVDISEVVETNYAASATVPSLGLEIRRGYVSVRASIGASRDVRFVCTHLEDVPFTDVQLAQAEELAASLPANVPVILAGDFNSPAPDGPTYEWLIAQGFKDTWNVSDGGFTWGHDPNLADDPSSLTQRLDLVLVRSTSPQQISRHLQVVGFDIWGDESGERTELGLWPSDHAAVIVRMRVAAKFGAKP